MINNPVNDGNRRQEGNHLHPTAAFRAGQRVKFVDLSDHLRWLRSPLVDIRNACGACHPWAEAEMKARIAEIQDKTAGLLREQDDSGFSLNEPMRTLDRHPQDGILLSRAEYN